MNEQDRGRGTETGSESDARIVDWSVNHSPSSVQCWSDWCRDIEKLSFLGELHTVQRPTELLFVYSTCIIK